ncbi:MAG: hypothetical protein KDG55_13865 [Rhodocyclaceae bacterium]|nr:hypothetical protein [Rhodocyclaceae bacterium]
MPPRSAKSLLAGLLLACSALACHAEAPTVRPGVFGTLGLSWHDARQLSYRSSQTQREGTRGGMLDSGIDSLLGLQLNVQAHERVDGAAQVVSRQHEDGGWLPRLTWAFVRLEPIDSLQLRLGRLGLDTTLGSNSRLIGYAFPAVRPAPELYSGIPIDSIDGADLTYLAPVGDHLFRLKLMAGDTSMHVAAAGQSFRLPDVRVTGAQLTYLGDNLQFRLSKGIAKTLDAGSLAPLVEALRQIPLPQTQTAAQRLDVNDIVTRYTGLDALYDRGPMRLQASLLRFAMPDGHPTLASQWLGQLMLSYRIERFVPYVGVAGARTSRRDTRTGLEGVPGLEALQVAAAGAVDNATLSQRATTIGVRYELRQGMALKFQIDRVHASASPVVTDLADPANDDRRLTLLSMALDFAF